MGRFLLKDIRLHFDMNLNKRFFILFQLDLQLQDESGGDISSFITNGEWELLGKYAPHA